MDKNLFDSAFQQARLKVYRANRHIQEAQHWVDTYLKSDVYDVVSDRNLHPGQQAIRVIAKPVPADLVLAIGDAFHCLSAALDYLMSGLMRAKTGDASRIHFPIDESRKALRKSFMAARPGTTPPPRRRIVEAFPLVALELLTVIKPYKGGNFAIWEIRKADNVDKHNLIIPSVTVLEVRGVDVVEQANNCQITDPSFRVGAGGIVNGFSFPAAGNLEITNKGHATVSISFAEGMEVFAGEPVFPTLQRCSQFVAETLDRVEKIATRYL